MAMVVKEAMDNVVNRDASVRSNPRMSQAFETIARIAANCCGTPLALIWLAEGDSFQYQVGDDEDVIPSIYDLEPLHRLTMQRMGVFAISDLFKHALHFLCPLDHSTLPVRFYAGVPLVGPDGREIGCLCVLDAKPRNLSEEQSKILLMLGRLGFTKTAWQHSRRRSAKAPSAGWQAAQTPALESVSEPALPAPDLVMERRQAAQALRQSEERFRALIENGSDIIMLLEHDGTICYTSPSGERVLGYRSETVIGDNVFNYVHPGDLDAVRKLQRDVLARPGEILRFDFRVRHQNGSWRYVEASVHNLLNRPGIEGIIVNARDITERKRAEGQTLRQVRRLQALRAIDLAITGSFDLQVTLNVVLDQIISLQGVHAAAVLIVNPHSQTLEYVARRGIEDYLRASPMIRMGEGAAGRAALERRLIMASDLIDAEEGIEAVHPVIDGESPGYYAVPLLAKGRANGVLEVFCKQSFTSDVEWLAFLEALAGQAAIAIENTTLFDGLQRSNIELTLAYDATIEGWSRALDLRDKETEGHTQRVTEMTLRLAVAMGLNDEELVHIRRGALLHDIGKMGVPDSILLKQDKLTDAEWEIMRRHTTYAYEMLSPIRFLRSAIDIPYCHHEKWDGTGYPRGLKGETIPLPARIFAVVDVWDALRSDRPYRPGLSETEVIEYLRSQSGKHFDPAAVEAFLRIISS